MAVLFDCHTPTDGGSYSLIASILEGLMSVKSNSKFELIFVSVGKSQNKFADFNFKPKNKLSRIVGKVLFQNRVSINNYQSKSKLARFLDKINIDLVFFLGVPAEITHIPFLLTIWDLQHRTHPWFPEISNQKAWLGRDAYYSKYLPRAAAVITGTERGKEEIVKFYGVDEQNIYIIPHVISESESNVFSSRNGPYIYPAQFWAHKNHYTIIRAIQTLRDVNQIKISVDFIGSDKGNLNYIRNVVKECELESQIRILGFVSAEEKIHLYSKARGLIYSSFSGPENLPPLEAYDAGMPVIYADFPGAREQLGDFPYYFDPNNELSLVEAIIEVENSNKNKLLDKLTRQRTFLKERRPETYAKLFLQLLDTLYPKLRAFKVKDFSNYF